MYLPSQKNGGGAPIREDAPIRNTVLNFFFVRQFPWYIDFVKHTFQNYSGVYLGETNIGIVCVVTEVANNEVKGYLLLRRENWVKRK